MTTTTPEPASGVVVPVADPLFTVAERQALTGSLSGYSGLTRDAYTLDLRQFTAWRTLHGLHLFAAKRVDIESFRGEMEAAGRARATIARRLCTIAGFYRYAVEEELLDHSPAAHVRRPRLNYESHATALDRNELGGLLVAAGLGTAQEHALISLLALNGLRISEALGADIGVPLRDVQQAASHADPRTTMRYDRARASLDRHVTYIVAAYVAGAAR
jgi:site-specific recombinase XerD